MGLEDSSALWVIVLLPLTFIVGIAFLMKRVRSHKAQAQEAQRKALDLQKNGEPAVATITAVKVVGARMEGAVDLRVVMALAVHEAPGFAAFDTEVTALVSPVVIGDFRVGSEVDVFVDRAAQAVALDHTMAGHRLP